MSKLDKELNEIIFNHWHDGHTSKDCRPCRERLQSLIHSESIKARIDELRNLEFNQKIELVPYQRLIQERLEELDSGEGKE